MDDVVDEVERDRQPRRELRRIDRELRQIDDELQIVAEGCERRQHLLGRGQILLDSIVPGRRELPVRQVRTVPAGRRGEASMLHGHVSQEIGESPAGTRRRPREVCGPHLLDDVHAVADGEGVHISDIRHGSMIVGDVVGGPRSNRLTAMNQFAVPGPVQFADAAVTVVGARVVGLSASAALLDRGARVTLVDRYDDEATTARAAQAEAQGAVLRLGDDETLPEGTELLIVSPGLPPSAPIVVAAQAAGVPIWGDAELAWRLRTPLPDGSYAPWLVVTGTNGKSTTVRMAEAMLKEAGKNVA